MNSAVTPPEQRLRKCQKQVRNNVTLEIAYQQSLAGNLVERSQQTHDFLILKVVQEQRADHVVKAPTREGQSKSVRDQLGVPGLLQVSRTTIQADHGSGRIELPD